MPQRLTIRERILRPLTVMAATGGFVYGAYKLNSFEDTHLLQASQVSVNPQIHPDNKGTNLLENKLPKKNFEREIILEARESYFITKVVVNRTDNKEPSTDVDTSETKAAPSPVDEDFEENSQLAENASVEYETGLKNSLENLDNAVSAQSSSRATVTVLTPGVPLGKVEIDTDSPTVWQVLADCETGDGQVGPPYYATWDSNGEFEGALQFLNSTWKSLKAAAGYDHAYQAPPEVQVAAAEELQVRGGWPQWPSCTERMIEQGFIK